MKTTNTQEEEDREVMYEKQMEEQFIN